MLGLMQDWPLTVDRILDHAARWHGEVEIVSRTVEGPIARTTYAEAARRARRFTNVLKALGVEPGDRVATMAWNGARHLEAWYGIMGMGAVCHTLNPRLPPEQICYIINHAEDKVLLADLTFLPLLMQHRAQMPSVRHVVAMTDAAHMGEWSERPDVACLESLLAEAPEAAEWGGFDENTAAGLCYTSGTTGPPKGVLYSHRSNFLHTLVTNGADAMAVRARDVVLPVVPMFHANAWGVVFSAPAAGAKLVLPGPRLDGASIHALLESEGVTFSGAVPTVWQMLLDHLRSTGGTLSSLERVVIGGSAVPESLVRAFRDDYGVEVIHAWGMTELSPTGTLATPTAAVAALPEADRRKVLLKQGRPPPGVEMKVTDAQGRALPNDGEAVGHVKVKGPFVAAGYYRGDGGEVLDEEGFFDTGDVGSIDTHGYLQVTDRAKDVIKSGGEWISSIAIETLAAGHPKCALAAVVAAAHPKWQERPVLLVKLQPGQAATREEFLQFLEGRIARWQLPDDVLFVEDLPLGATGKIDKKLIRERMKGYVLPTAAQAEG